MCVLVCFRRVSSYVPKNYHGLVVRCNAMGWFLIFIETHAEPTFQNVQMPHHNLSFSSKDCELDSHPLVLNKPWCDVIFRSQIVYMIYTGTSLKPRLIRKMQHIMYVYIIQCIILGGWRCMFISFWEVFCHHKHRVWKTFSLGIRHEVRSEWTSLAHWPISSPATNIGSAQYIGILEFS